MEERQPIKTMQVECPHWVEVQEEKRARMEGGFGLQSGIFSTVKYVEEPQRHFPLVIAMQPDGTVVTRAFCHRGHDYCRGCPYEQGLWIDRPVSPEGT